MLRLLCVSLGSLPQHLLARVHLLYCATVLYCTVSNVLYCVLYCIFLHLAIVWYCLAPCCTAPVAAMCCYCMAWLPLEDSTNDTPRSVLPPSTQRRLRCNTLLNLLYCHVL